MIKVVAKAKVKKEYIAQYKEITQELIDSTREEDGCVSYSLYGDIEDHSILTFIETWESKEHLDAHFETEHFKRIVPKLGEMQECDTEVNIYSEIVYRANDAENI